MSNMQGDIYSYILQVHFIKMKVKFPCKMRLQYNGDLITTEVGINEQGKFIFNQQIVLKQQFQTSQFNITVNITTSKGSKYIAGILLLDSYRLRSHQGQYLTFNLNKCIDSQAFCQIKVLKAQQPILQRKITFAKTKQHQQHRNETKTNARKHLKIHLDQEMDIDNIDRMYSPNANNTKQYLKTKSEYQFPINNNSQMHKKNSNIKKMYDQGNLSIKYYPKHRVDRREQMKNYLDPTLFDIEHYQGQQIDPLLTDSRNRLIEAQVYKQSYHKLKQKLKKQMQISKSERMKRSSLEQSQGHHKLQIMRLKLMLDENQKQIMQKNSSLKQLQNDQLKLHRNQQTISALKIQLQNKDNKIRALEESIKKLQRQHDNLSYSMESSLNRKQKMDDSYRLKQLQREVQLANRNLRQKEGQFQFKIRQKDSILMLKLQQFTQKQENLIKQKNQSIQSEKQLSMKINKLQSEYNHEKESYKEKINEYQATIDRLEREKQNLHKQIKQSNHEQQKIKSYICKVQYDQKIIKTHEIDNYKQQLSAELKLIKQKNQQLKHENKMVTEEKNHLQKELSKMLESYSLQINNMKREYKIQLDQIKDQGKKIYELQGQIEQKKAENQRLQRNYQTLNKQCLDAKDKQSSTRRQLKNKDQELLMINGQIENLKHRLRNSQSIGKYELQSLRDELYAKKKQLDHQCLKNISLMETNSKNNDQLNLLRIKLANQTGQQSQLQQSSKKKIKQIEQKLAAKQKTLNITEMQKIKKQDEIKTILQKYQNIEIQFKKKAQESERIEKQLYKKSQELAILANEYSMQEKKYQELINQARENEDKAKDNMDHFRTLKASYNQISSDKAILDKQLDAQKKYSSQLKQKIDKITGQYNSKEQMVIQLQKQLQNSKSENQMQSLQIKKVKKQAQRFTERLQQNFRIILAQIPSKEAKNCILPKQPQTQFQQNSILNFSGDVTSDVDIIQKIVNQHLTIRTTMLKLIDTIKYLNKQLESLHSKFNKAQNLAKNSQMELKQSIESLQKQLEAAHKYREQLIEKYDCEIVEIRGQIANKESENIQLMNQLQENQFLLNSMKMENQANNNHYEIKANQYALKIKEYELRIKQIKQFIESEQEKKDNLQADIQTKNNQLELLTQTVNKNNSHISSITEQNAKYIQQIQQLKKQKKKLVEQNSDLSCKFNTEVDINLKIKEQLLGEELKGVQLKQFLNTLIKQKQTAIKNQLQKSQEINNLEIKLSEVNREKDIIDEQFERIKKINEEQKQSLRKMRNQKKIMEQSLIQEKQKAEKYFDKIKSLEKGYREKYEQFEKNQQELLKRIQNKQLGYKQLNKENEDLIKQLAAAKQEIQIYKSKNNQDIGEFTEKFKKLKIQKQRIQQELNLSKIREKQEREQSQKLNKQLEESRRQSLSLSKTISQINQEIKQKQQEFYKLSGTVYSLERQLKQSQQKYLNKQEEMYEEYSTKQQNLIEDYQTKIQIVEKSRDYFRQKFQQSQENNRTLLERLKSDELQEGCLRKTLEEKIKRLEEERLNLISLKNSQIQKLSEQNKTNFQSQKHLEAALRRTQHQLDVCKNSLKKMEDLSKQNEQKLKSNNKIYLTQIETLKANDREHRIFKQSLTRSVWEVERQFKKIIQNSLRSVVMQGNQMDKVKLAENYKKVQQNTINVLNRAFTIKQ